MEKKTISLTSGAGKSGLPLVKEGNYKQGEKTAFRMGEKNSKQSN